MIASHVLLTVTKRFVACMGLITHIFHRSFSKLIFLKIISNVFAIRLLEPHSRVILSFLRFKANAVVRVSSVSVSSYTHTPLGLFLHRRRLLPAPRGVCLCMRYTLVHTLFGWLLESSHPKSPLSKCFYRKYPYDLYTNNNALSRIDKSIFTELSDWYHYLQ